MPESICNLHIRQQENSRSGLTRRVESSWSMASLPVDRKSSCVPSVENSGTDQVRDNPAMEVVHLGTKCFLASSILRRPHPPPSSFIQTIQSYQLDRLVCGTACLVGSPTPSTCLCPKEVDQSRIHATWCCCGVVYYWHHFTWRHYMCVEQRIDREI